MEQNHIEKAIQNGSEELKQPRGAITREAIQELTRVGVHLTPTNRANLTNSVRNIQEDFEFLYHLAQALAKENLELRDKLERLTQEYVRRSLKERWGNR